jgi:Ca-activated chloride channel family protein
MTEVELFSGFWLGNPGAFVWLALPALIFLICFSVLKMRGRGLRALIHPDNQHVLVQGESKERAWLSSILLTLGALSLSIALMQPKWGFQWEEIHREGVDLIVAVDVSKSMMAKDMAPNRLARAKRKILDLLDLLEGDRVGLIAFAGTSYLQCPLTLDYGAFQMFLDLLGPDLIPQQGTAIDEAIRQGIQAFEKSPRNSKAMILITDGEEHSGQYLEAAKEAAEKGIRIYTIGFGSPEGQPVPDPDNENHHLKDRFGNIVISKLNEEVLQKIALETKGAYTRALTTDDDLKRIYLGEITGALEKNKLSSTRRKRYEHRFQWFLLAGWFLLFLEVLLRTAPNLLKPIKPVAAILLLCSSASAADNPLKYFGFPSNKEKSYHSGMKAYKEGDYTKAIDAFSAPEATEAPDALDFYNAGAAFYKAGNYEQAAQEYEKVLKAEDPSLAGSARYNLGNVAFRQGKLEDAVSQYEEALKLAPEHEKAKKNLEYVRKLLKKHQNQQKKQENQQNKQNQDKNNQKNQSKDNKNQNEENQKQSKGDSQDKEQSQKQEKQKNDSQNQSDEDKNKEQKQDAQKQQEKKQQEQKSAENSKNSSQGASQQMKQMSKEEAQKFLNRLSSENLDHMRDMIHRKLQDKYVPGKGKEW